MSRAFEVFFGAVLIVSLWCWMILAHKGAPTTTFGWFDLAGDFLLACFMTGPIYREYLR